MHGLFLHLFASVHISVTAPIPAINQGLGILNCYVCCIHENFLKVLHACNKDNCKQLQFFLFQVPELLFLNTWYQMYFPPHSNNCKEITGFASKNRISMTMKYIQASD